MPGARGYCAGWLAFAAAPEGRERKVGTAIPHAVSAACTFGSAKSPRPPRPSAPEPVGRGGGEPDGRAPGENRREGSTLGDGIPAACHASPHEQGRRLPDAPAAGRLRTRLWRTWEPHVVVLMLFPDCTQPVPGIGAQPGSMRTRATGLPSAGPREHHEARMMAMAGRLFHEFEDLPVSTVFQAIGAARLELREARAGVPSPDDIEVLARQRLLAATWRDGGGGGGRD